MTALQFNDKCTFVRRDDFEKKTTVFTRTHVFVSGTPTWREGYYFAAGKQDDGEINYSLIFETAYTGGWGFWESAKDQNGKQFSLNRYEAWRDDSLMWERCGVRLSREYLESVRKTGITWRLYRDSPATSTPTLLPQVIDGFLMKVDEVFHSPPPPSPAADTPPAPRAVDLASLPNATDMSAQQYKDSLTFVSRDDSNKTTTVKTGKIYYHLTDSLTEYYQLIATRKDEGEILFEIVTYSNRTPPDFLERVVNQNGDEFPMKEINTNPTGDAIMGESHSIQISREFLEGMRKTGITLKFYGKKVVITLSIWPQVVDGFLMRVDEVFKQ